MGLSIFLSLLFFLLSLHFFLKLSCYFVKRKYFVAGGKEEVDRAEVVGEKGEKGKINKVIAKRCRPRVQFL